MTRVLNDELTPGTYSFILAGTLPTGQTESDSFDIIVAASSDEPVCPETETEEETSDPTDEPALTCSDIEDQISLEPFF